MKFKQKVFIFIVILIVDMILAWGAVRMWKGRGEIFDTHEGKPVDTGRIPVPGEGMTTEVSGHDHSGAGRSEKAVSDLYGQQEDIAKKYTALTFDDGPNPKYTKPLLDGLRERGIRVTFFLVGECIDGNEDLVKQMAKDGHLIGVHCMTHKDLKREAFRRRKRTLDRTGEDPGSNRDPAGVCPSALWELECEAGGGRGHDPRILGCGLHRLAVEKYGEGRCESGERHGGRGYYPDA